MRVRPAIRYIVNVAVLSHRDDGWLTATSTVVRLTWAELRTIPRRARLKWSTMELERWPYHVPAPVDEILETLDQLGIAVERTMLDRAEIRKHLESYSYPRFYAGGPVTEGGARQFKILEYFISLQLLPVEPTDTVIDVASERSLFPDLVRRRVGARVFRQDLIYTAGLHGDRIGGSADHMPITTGFATKLFLHNSFEHFEGNVDTRFIREAWRVLRPGGGVCIVPLFLSDRHRIITDPLIVDSDELDWRSEGKLVRAVGYRNRFGRHYTAETFSERVFRPAVDCGFLARVYHIEKTHKIQPAAAPEFALILVKPDDV